MRLPSDFYAARSEAAANLELRIDNAIDAAGLEQCPLVRVPIEGFQIAVVHHVTTDYRRWGWKVTLFDDCIQLEPG